MSSIDAALASVTRLGIDTSPFIYLIERHPLYVERVRAIIRRVGEGSLLGLTSTLTLTEVLVQPIRRGNFPLAQRYQRFLTRGRNLVLTPIDVRVAAKAAELRARYGLRTPDALHAASALAAGCEAFLTNDVRFKQLGELRVIILAEIAL